MAFLLVCLPRDLRSFPSLFHSNVLLVKCIKHIVLCSNALYVGVYVLKPRAAEGAVFREALDLGSTEKTEKELIEIIARLRLSRFKQVIIVSIFFSILCLYHGVHLLRY